jgi:hypothetical protein
MNIHLRLLMTGFMTLLAVMLGASAASASRSLRVEPAGGLTASARLQLGEVEGRLPRTTSVVCNVTLLKTLERSIAKAAGTAFGKITGIAIDRGTPAEPHCISELNPVEEITPLKRAGEACTHRELGSGVLLYDCSGAPAENWRLVYDSFGGTLPRINGINFHIGGVRFIITVRTIPCLYGAGEAAYGLAEVNTEGRITNATAVLERTALRLVESSPLCPFPVGSFSGTFTLHTSERVTLV